jgi:hypothetical protein
MTAKQDVFLLHKARTAAASRTMLIVFGWNKYRNRNFGPVLASRSS